MVHLSGIVGAIALVTAALLVARLLDRSRARHHRVGLGAAFVFLGLAGTVAVAGAVDGVALDAPLFAAIALGFAVVALLEGASQAPVDHPR